MVELECDQPLIMLYSMEVVMSAVSEKSFTIDITPTWEAATRIYLSVLDNRNASPKARRAAQDDLLRLARCLDHVIAERKGDSNE
jgi:hypothetical protein